FLPLPDLDIARDVNQFQIYLVEDRSGTVEFIHQAVDRTLEHEIRSGFLARRFYSVSTGVLRLIKTFLATLLALSVIGDKLHLSRLREGAFEVFHEGLGIELLMGTIQYRTHNNRGFAPRNLGKALGPGMIEGILDQGLCGQARVGIVPA